MKRRYKKFNLNLSKWYAVKGCLFLCCLRKVGDMEKPRRLILVKMEHDLI